MVVCLTACFIEQVLEIFLGKLRWEGQFNAELDRWWRRAGAKCKLHRMTGGMPFTLEKCNSFAVGLGTLLKNNLVEFNLLHFSNSDVLIVALHNNKLYI